MPYQIDASVFIDAHDDYPSHTFFSIMDWIERSYKRSSVYSVETVKEELSLKNDPVSEWVNRMEDSFYLSWDIKDNAEREKLEKWINDKFPARKHKFFDGADIHLVTKAISRNFIVVTHETVSQSKKIPKIPVVCKEFKVECLTLIQMLAKERYAFSVQSFKEIEETLNIRARG